MNLIYQWAFANKIASKFATTMYTTFKQEQALPIMKHVGAVTKVKKDDSVFDHEIRAIRASFDPALKTLLFIGGSAGANVFNRFIDDNEALMTQFNVINITGDPQLNASQKNLYRIDYVTDLYQALMNQADVVVTRGGSNTIFELLAMTKLQIIIPLGKEASRGDQLENAQYFEKHHYARQLSEDSLSLEKLIEEVNALLKNQESYKDAMRQSHEITSPERFYELLRADISSKTKDR